MISARDVVTGLYAAWRLLLFDRTAVQYLDGTVTGFWKSFYAAAIALPGAFILRRLFLDVNPEFGSDAGMGRIATVFALDYVYQWVLFPFVMIYLAEAMGRSQRYVSFIVARNWSQVIQMIIVLPAAVIFAAGSADETTIGQALLVAAYMVTWVYAWFIARTALDITGLAALFVVITELAASVAISFTSEVLIGGG